jgi:hypothetical protein
LIFLFFLHFFFFFLFILAHALHSLNIYLTFFSVRSIRWLWILFFFVCWWWCWEKGKCDRSEEMKKCIWLNGWLLTWNFIIINFCLKSIHEKNAHEILPPKINDSDLFCIMCMFNVDKYK